MTTRREAVIAYRDAVRLSGATEIRLSMTTDDAMALGAELADSEIRFPEKLKAATAAYKAATEAPEPEEFDAKLAWMKARGNAADAFWDSFEGQDVSGVTIIRRR